MNENRYIKRLYDDKEAGALLKRATEMQAEASHASPYSLTFQDIEEIAIELGVDAEHIRRAAVELELEDEFDTSRSLNLLGGPFEAGLQRRFDGALTEKQWEEIVLALRRLTGSTGVNTSIGQLREWVHRTDFETIRVSIAEEDDRSTLTVSKTFRGAVSVGYLVSFLLTGTLAAISLDGSGFSDMLASVIVGTAGVGGLAGVRASIGYWTKRQKRKLKRLGEALQGLITQPAAATPERAPSMEIDGLEIDGLEFDAPQTGQAAVREKRISS